LDIDWVLDERGRLDAPVLRGFSLAVVRPPLVTIQLRCEAPGTAGSAGDRRLQLRVTAEGARDLAEALLHAAQLIDDAPEVGRLN